MAYPCIEMDSEIVELVVPQFMGSLDPKNFCKWLNIVERTFFLRSLSEEAMFELVISKLKGHALWWFEHLMLERQRHDEPVLNSWSDLKVELEKRFNPLVIASGVNALSHFGVVDCIEIASGCLEPILSCTNGDVQDLTPHSNQNEHGSEMLPVLESQQSVVLNTHGSLLSFDKPSELVEVTCESVHDHEVLEAKEVLHGLYISEKHVEPENEKHDMFPDLVLEHEVKKPPWNPWSKWKQSVNERLDLSFPDRTQITSWFKGKENLKEAVSQESPGLLSLLESPRPCVQIIQGHIPPPVGVRFQTSKDKLPPEYAGSEDSEVTYKAESDCKVLQADSKPTLVLIEECDAEKNVGSENKLQKIFADHIAQAGTKFESNSVCQPAKHLTAEVSLFPANLHGDQTPQSALELAQCVAPFNESPIHSLEYELEHKFTEECLQFMRLKVPAAENGTDSNLTEDSQHSMHTEFSAARLFLPAGKLYETQARQSTPDPSLLIPPLNEPQSLYPIHTNDCEAESALTGKCQQRAHRKHPTAVDSLHSYSLSENQTIRKTLEFDQPVYLQEGLPESEFIVQPILTHHKLLSIFSDSATEYQLIPFEVHFSQKPAGEIEAQSRKNNSESVTMNISPRSLLHEYELPLLSLDLLQEGIKDKLLAACNLLIGVVQRHPQYGVPKLQIFLRLGFESPDFGVSCLQGTKFAEGLKTISTCALNSEKNSYSTCEFIGFSSEYYSQDWRADHEVLSNHLLRKGTLDVNLACTILVFDPGILGVCSSSQRILESFQIDQPSTHSSLVTLPYVQCSMVLCFMSDTRVHTVLHMLKPKEEHLACTFFVFDPGIQVVHKLESRLPVSTAVSSKSVLRQPEVELRVSIKEEPPDSTL